MLTEETKKRLKTPWYLKLEWADGVSDSEVDCAYVMDNNEEYVFYRDLPSAGVIDIMLGVVNSINEMAA